jgi:Gnt-I system high-affinity gluconate transporter
MAVLIVILCIAVLIVLISVFKLNAFLAFLVVSLLTGLLLGMDFLKLSSAIQKGMADMLGSLVIIIVCGAMLGKLVAESGAAQRIASGIMSLFGERYVQWALLLTGFIIGIPLFYTVGFVLVMPLIFTVVYRYKLPPVYVGLPMLAALSVTHGFLPPHPSPSALIVMFDADMGKTLAYGILVAIPTVVIAGPIFSRLLPNIKPQNDDTFEVKSKEEQELPGLFNSVATSLLPVILLGATTALLFVAGDNDSGHRVVKFLSDPQIVMLLSVLVATFTLGVNMKMSMKRVMDFYGDAVKDVALLLLIISGAGALKQILVDTQVSDDVAGLLKNLDIHPLILGWTVAAVTRVCVGSATVAGLTAAGITLPLLKDGTTDPNLMVLSIGAGSLMFSHVNDAGFWLYKEYFNLSIKDTIRSWSFMETIVAVCGLIGVMIINAIIH